MSIEVTNELIEDIASAVLKKQRKLTRKQQKLEANRRLRNTRMLLEHYRPLTDHILLSEKSEVETMEYEIEHGTVIRLESVGKYHEKSRQLLKYINMALAMYKERCVNWDDLAFRRYRTIEWLYLSTSHLSEGEIAKYYNVDRSVINRDKDRAINELSVLLFGIDAILDGFTSR
mgnify:FL=1